jgi:hypothetical protein
MSTKKKVRTSYIALEFNEYGLYVGSGDTKKDSVEDLLGNGANFPDQIIEVIHPVISKEYHNIPVTTMRFDNAN